MRSYLLSILLFGLSLLSYSQTDSTFAIPPDTTGGDDFSYFYTEEERAKYLNYKPIIGIGTGVIKFYGDITDAYNSNPYMGNNGVNLSVSRDLNNFFSVHFNAIYANLMGQTHSLGEPLNFKTDILNGTLFLSYNFYHILRKPDLLISYRKQRKLIPNIALGLSAFNFASKGDLYAANGSKYHYWSDGTIRNQSESPQNELSSVLLQRDYNYETDLRELNLDSLGKYTKAAFAVPIDFSVDYNLHERVILKFGTTYYWVFNDNVDNISIKGEGARKGKTGGDNYLYTYVSIKFDLFSDEKEVFEDGTVMLTEDMINALMTEDEDNDGVSDVWDQCLGTPAGVTIDPNGCPLDDDNDGFANFQDKELLTEKDSITNMEGVKLTEAEWISYSDTTDAIPFEMICDYYPSMCYDNPRDRYRNLFVEIPEKFAKLDTDADGYISIEEVSRAIDEFFNMTSSYTIDDVYALTEFFFSQ